MMEEDLQRKLMGDTPENVGDQDPNQRTIMDQFYYKVVRDVNLGLLPPNCADKFQEYLNALKNETMNEWYQDGILMNCTASIPITEEKILRES